jgi:hypothetical protein
VRRPDQVDRTVAEQIGAAGLERLAQTVLDAGAAGGARFRRQGDIVRAFGEIPRGQPAEGLWRSGDDRFGAGLEVTLSIAALYASRNPGSLGANRMRTFFWPLRRT